eukprot:11197682-Alexandrium_andersonii.AAC.1
MQFPESVLSRCAHAPTFVPPNIAVHSGPLVLPDAGRKPERAPESDTVRVGVAITPSTYRQAVPYS